MSDVSRSPHVPKGPGPRLAALNEVDIAGALRQAREEARLSVSALARGAQTSRAAVHAYETGSREPSVSTALRILRACGYTLDVVSER